MFKKGFTLIELMVVVGIIAVLLTVTMPAVKGLMESSQLAQADNQLRAILYSARAYAISQRVVSGVRFQEDGHMVPIYSRPPINTGIATYSLQNYRSFQPYDMAAVAGIEPERMTDPWRVTVSDVGNTNYVGSNSGTMWRTWLPAYNCVGDGYSGNNPTGFKPDPRWMNEEDAWFVTPVVLFSPAGRVMLAECMFSGNSNNPWNAAVNLNTPNNAFIKAVYCDKNGILIPNNTPIPSHNYIKYTYQNNVAGWVCNDYKGRMSHDIPVESPTVTTKPRIFNYKEFRARLGPFNSATSGTNGTMNLALEVIVATASDCTLDVNTGLPIRTKSFNKIKSN